MHTIAWRWQGIKLSKSLVAKFPHPFGPHLMASFQFSHRFFLPSRFLHAGIVKPAPHLKPALVPRILPNNGIKCRSRSIGQNDGFGYTYFIHGFHPLIQFGVRFRVIMGMKINDGIFRLFNICPGYLINGNRAKIFQFQMIRVLAEYPGQKNGCDDTPTNSIG